MKRHTLIKLLFVIIFGQNVYSQENITYGVDFYFTETNEGILAAENTITAANKVSSIKYIANTKIVLKQGFSAKPTNGSEVVLVVGSFNVESSSDDSSSDDNKLSKDSFEKEIVTFPNPVNNILNLSWSNFDIINVRVLTIDGKVFFENNKLTNDQKSLSISFENYATGIYFVQLEDKRGDFFTKKIIKNN